MKILTLLLILLLPIASHASFITILSGSVDGVCTTPADGDILNEGFLGTGYEVSGWSETTGSSATLNEDYTLTGTPPADSCTEGLYINVPTSSGDTSITYTHDSNIARDIDFYFDFRINSYTLPATQDAIVLLVVWNSSWGNTVKVQLYNYNYPGVDFRVVGSTTAALTTLSTETWYTAKIHLDATAADSYYQIDGGSEVSFTSQSRDAYYMRLGATGVDSNEAIQIQYGRFWVDTP